MIISQTPYRVSFAGGGTDLPAFYQREAGAVLSAALNHHMYVTVHKRFAPNIRVAYSTTETAAAVDEIKHELVREALRLAGLDTPMEITTIGDVPAGTGLGSSSTLTVGLLKAFHAYKGDIVTPQQLGCESCKIEIEILKKPIGRQDQYAAAHGGLNYMRFNPDDTVDVEPVPCRAETLAELERRSLLMYTNTTRSADAILERQGRETAGSMAVLRQMRDLAGEMRSAIAGRGDLDRFASLLHDGWELKRALGCGITNNGIDEQYRASRAAGAQGGKLLGAGGGGFMLIMAPPDRHDSIREALGHPRELPFRLDRLGSRIVFLSA